MKDRTYKKLQSAIRLALRDILDDIDVCDKLAESINGYMTEKQRAAILKDDPDGEMCDRLEGWMRHVVYLTLDGLEMPDLRETWACHGCGIDLIPYEEPCKGCKCHYDGTKNPGPNYR